MKILCSKANLLSGVQIVSKAVPSKTTMSILECILIDASKGVISLTGNDMELGIETVVSVWPTIDERSENYGEMADKGYLENMLRENADKASYIARKTLSKVYRKIGFLAK